MPTKRQKFALWDPRPEVQAVLNKLKRGETSERIEWDAKYQAVAMSNHAEVAVLLCHNWLRDPGTGARGKDLIDLKAVHMYDREVDGGEYKQAFWVIMWSLRSVGENVDTARLVGAKRALMRKCALGFDRHAQQDKLAWLFERARQFETLGAFLRPRLFAIGAPIESEKYGEGAVLGPLRVKQARLQKRLETTVQLGKGGISGVTTNLGRITLQDSNG